MSMFDALAASFPPSAIHWRSQQVFERNGQYSALALAYIDARDVMERLDAVCGPWGWQDSYIETTKGRVICSLSIAVDGQWISKSDGAGDTEVEGDKGGISDAFKRAGVKWGIGRYLYAISNVYAPCEANKRGDKLYFKKWKPEADRIFAEALAKVSPPRKVQRITDEQRAELMTLLEHLGVPVAEFLKVAKLKDLRELPAEKFEGAKGWINEQAKAKRQTLAEEIGDDIPY
jgi:hypothetical protein